eukprot:364619_1
MSLSGSEVVGTERQRNRSFYDEVLFDVASVRVKSRPARRDTRRSSLTRNPLVGEPVPAARIHPAKPKGEKKIGGSGSFARKFIFPTLLLSFVLLFCGAEASDTDPTQ